MSGDLDGLLAEPPAVVRDRAREWTSARWRPGQRVALFGAGNIGWEVLRALRSVEIEPVAFLDETPGKAGTFVEGVPVWTPAEARSRLAEPPCVVVTILNARHRYPETEARFRRDLGFSTIPFLALPWCLDRLEHIAFQTEPARLLAARDRILGLAEALADDVSRQVLANQVRFRLTLDFATLDPAQPDPYFPADVALDLPPGVHFVDAGAYEGDSVAAFLRARDDAFSGISAFEPDPTTFGRLEQYVRGLPSRIRERVRASQVAVGGQRGELRFRASGDMNAAFDPDGELTVPVETLEALVGHVEAPLYMKFDIEGAEREALGSAGRWIEERRPTLAVSVYHRPSDLWELPLFLAERRVGYRLWLRSHGIEGTDVVCYAT